MPELPEVESARLYAAEHLQGKIIASVKTEPDDIVFPYQAHRSIPRKLKGRTILDLQRRGKHMWFEMDQRPWPTFHFGMTGSFEIYRDTKERPRFWKIEITTTDGIRLAMVNKRRLGRIRLLDDPENEPPISELGFDPLLAMPKLDVFSDLVRRRKTPVKALLLNQQFAAGVGNWVADDILFQAGIDPRRKASDLSPQEIKNMRQIMLRIIKKAVEARADETYFPKNWLFHHRWGKPKEAKTDQGDPIEFLTVGGRTTAWVPARQH